MQPDTGSGKRKLATAIVALLITAALCALVMFGLPRAKRWLAARACSDVDVAACEQACALGQAATGGCLDAARNTRDGSYEARQAKTLALLDRACQLGEAEGCVEALHKTRREDKRREGWTTRACELGLAEQCEPSVGLTLGRHPANIEAPATRACQLLPGEAERAQCLATWRLRATIALALRSACDTRERNACSKLGAALLPYDATAALEAYAAECELRGTAGLYSAYTFECADGLEWYEGPSPRSGAESCGFELLKADTAARQTLQNPGLGSPTPAEPAASGAFPLAEAATVRLVVSPPDEALHELLAAREPAAQRCFDPRAAGAGLTATTLAAAREQRKASPRRYSARFDVDRFGEIPRRDISSLVSPAESACLGAVYFSNLPAPASGRRVSLSFTLNAL